MSSSRVTAISVGALFLIATATFATAERLLVGVLARPGYVPGAPNDTATMAIAALLAFVDALAVVAIAVLMYPALRPSSESLAQGYIVLRVAEFAAVLFFMASPLLANAIGQMRGTVDQVAAQQLGLVVRGEHDLAFRLVYLLTGAAGCAFALALYRARLAPRAIVVLGLIGYPVLLAGTALDLFGVTNVADGAGLLAVVPGALFELIFPIWLFAKGFSGSAVTRGRATALATA